MPRCVVTRRDRVVRQFDHTTLNLAVPGFADLNPSAAHIAVVGWRVRAPALTPAALQRIRLGETDQTYVDCHGA